MFSKSSTKSSEYVQNMFRMCSANAASVSGVSINQYILWSNLVICEGIIFTMDLLISKFEKEGIKPGTNQNFTESSALKTFLTTNSEIILDWLDCIFQKQISKNNIMAVELRKEGNDFFVKKDYEKCMQYYTSSMCYAEPYSEMYVLSYSNRSAVFLEIGDFKNCLKCVRLCFKLGCPENTKVKLLIRKAECYFNLHEEQELENTVKDTKDFITNCQFLNPQEKEKHLSKLDKLLSTFQNQTKLQQENVTKELPVPKNGHNKDFIFAASTLKIQKTKEHGRYVITQKKLNVGDILFVEKAFSFAPLLSEKRDVEPSLMKCFHCLSDCFGTCVPCISCTVAIYCGDKCRAESWQEFHRWECLGMQTELWRELEIGFLAFRVFLRGLPSRFAQLSPNYDFVSLPFGDINDNYRYFNSLLTDFSKMEDVTKILLSSAVIVLYLKKYTNFYETNVEKSGCDKLEDFINLSGGLICRHISQLLSNSSVIHHPYDNIFTNFIKKDFSSFRKAVACGIYPSISIMNHSCKSNISIYYINDIAVVKAIEDIEAGGEIFNCYGMDYRRCTKEVRQEKCQNVYRFTCDCVICKNPHLEVENYDTFRCKFCEGPLAENKSEDCLFTCMICVKNVQIPQFKEIESKIRNLYSCTNSEKNILLHLDEFGKTLYDKHTCFVEIYTMLADISMEQGNVFNLVKYSKLIIETEKNRLGKYSMDVGTKLYVLLKCIVACIERKEIEDLNNFKKEIVDVSQMYEEMKKILNLYFHLPNNYFQNLEIPISTLNAYNNLLNANK